MRELNGNMTSYVPMIALLIQVRTFTFVLMMTCGYIRLRRRRNLRNNRCCSPRLKATRQFQPMHYLLDPPETPTFVNETSQAGFQSASSSECSTATSKIKSKKRKINDESDDRFIESITLFCEKTYSKIDELTSQMVRDGWNNDAVKKREGLYSILCRFDFLTLPMRVRVSMYFAKNPNELDLFYSFPDDAKVELLLTIMKSF